MTPAPPQVRIRAIGFPHRDLLLQMYGRFEPLGAALGLPPRLADSRRQWVDSALHHDVNAAAFTSRGELAGHCFLVPGDACSAEVAVFVHQEFRRKGLGTALLKTALEWAAAVGIRRVWGLTASDNRAALRLLTTCGFRSIRFASQEAELEIHLPAPWSACEMPRLACDLLSGMTRSPSRTAALSTLR